MARKHEEGPASDPELLILSSLAGGPKHGYGMMLDIQTFAGIELGPGTLYGAITRLVDHGSWRKSGWEGCEPYDQDADCPWTFTALSRRVAR